jgi:hypothetical protein
MLRDRENPYCPNCGSESDAWEEMDGKQEVLIMRCRECFTRFFWNDETNQDEVLSGPHAVIGLPLSRLQKENIQRKLEILNQSMKQMLLDDPGGFRLAHIYAEELYYLLEAIKAKNE